MTGFKMGYVGAIAMGMAVAVMVATPADARRGGSFGSRGARTHTAPAATSAAPNQAAPVQRSMTPNKNPTQAASPAGQMGKPAAKSGGMAKGLIGGLIAGGLIGALLGNGFGGLAGSGFLMALLQIALIGGLVWFALRLFRRKSAQAPALAGAPAGGMASPFMAAVQPAPAPAPARSFAFGGAPVAQQSEDIPIDQADKETFERLLFEVQDAFGREDYASLRERTTPEVMSYFAEELSQNATNGRRNQVSGTELLEAEVAEAWREGHVDYATIAMRYESIDVMLDRNSGAVIEGDATRATQTTELWTFVREPNAAWRLSAVQAA